jgi:hypothetical protein
MAEKEGNVYEQADLEYSGKEEEKSRGKCRVTWDKSGRAVERSGREEGERAA